MSGSRYWKEGLGRGGGDGFSIRVTYLKCVVQVGFIVRLRRPDSALLAQLEILYRQTLNDKVPIQTAGNRPIHQWPGNRGLR